MNYWLAVGSPENWKKSFKQNYIWGLTNRQRHWWEKLSEGDSVLFYATKPVSGVIGYGTIQTKFRQDRPTWPQEIKEGKILWPLGFEFTVKYCLPEDKWDVQKISSDTLKLKAGVSFQPIEAQFGQQLVSELEPTSPVVTTEPSLSLHEELKKKLIEIGKLQHYIAEQEYSFDIGKLDIVWRKVLNSVPTYVFEVQVGGDVYHALAKLKHAFDLWNSHIFIVASETDRNKVGNLVTGTFHEIGDRIKFIELEQVEELYKRKRAYLDFEKELGIQ